MKGKVYFLSESVIFDGLQKKIALDYERYE